MIEILQKDRNRYKNGKMPKFQKYYRLAQSSDIFFVKALYRLMFKYYKSKNLIDLYYGTCIGEGLYIGHPYCITINEKAILGKNINIHKGVTIGQENRGTTIGDNVWIGINSTIVGNIKIGDDVLIAPNAYVNCDVPSHSIVFGNPCIITHKDFATEGYINNTVY